MKLCDLADMLKGRVSFRMLPRVTKSALCTLPAKAYIADQYLYPHITSYSLRYGAELVWRLMTLSGARSRMFNVLRTHSAFLSHLNITPEILKCRSCNARFADSDALSFCDVCGLVSHDHDPCSLSLKLTRYAKGIDIRMCEHCFERVSFVDTVNHNGPLHIDDVKLINKRNIESVLSGRGLAVHSGNIKALLKQVRAEN